MSITRPHLRTPLKKMFADIAMDRYERLVEIARLRRIGVAAIIREAIDHYLATHPDAAPRETVDPSTVELAKQGAKDDD